MGRLTFTIFTVLLSLVSVSQAVQLALKSYKDGPGGPNNPEVFGYRGFSVSNSDLTEAQFMTEVATAARDMYRLHVQLSGGTDDGFCPKAMTGVTLDRRTIYFHSSVKGAGATTVLTLLGNGASREVQDALARCTAAAEEAERQRTGQASTPKRHINSANCGEIMASNYYTQQTGRSIGTAPPPKWIVTYASDGQTLLEPCSDTLHNVNYGCLQFVSQLGFMVCPSLEERQRVWAVHQQQLGQYWVQTYANSPDPSYQAYYAAAVQYYQQKGYWPEANFIPQQTGAPRRRVRRAVSQAQVKTAVLNMLKGVCSARKNIFAKLPPPCKAGLIVQTKKVGTKMLPVLVMDAKKKVKIFNCVADPKAPKCTATQKLVNGKCVTDPTKATTKCTATQKLVNGKCVTDPAKATTKCTPTQKLVNGKCVTDPAKATTKCTATQKLVNGKCVPKVNTPTTPTTKCTATQELFGGKCVLRCKAPKKRNARGVCA